MIQRHTPKPNSDSYLSTERIVMKYSLLFARYFLPSYAYSVLRCEECWESGEMGRYGAVIKEGRNYMHIVARVKIHYQVMKGDEYTAEIDMEKIENWRSNLRLYDFVGATGIIQCENTQGSKL